MTNSKCPCCNQTIEIEPIEVDNHWNCGVCGCSHKYYGDALDCQNTYVCEDTMNRKIKFISQETQKGCRKRICKIDLKRDDV